MLSELALRVRHAVYRSFAEAQPHELHTLAGPWFEGRLALDWKPRPRESSQEILTVAGFRGSFWSLSG
jgi:hypothetical protein